jgi:hypothetical protein
VKPKVYHIVVTTEPAESALNDLLSDYHGKHEIYCDFSQSKLSWDEQHRQAAEKVTNG